MDFKVMIDTVWVLLAAILVFFMNLGFAAVESGLARQKNAVNILSKNFIVFAVSSLIRAYTPLHHGSLSVNLTWVCQSTAYLPVLLL